MRELVGNKRAARTTKPEGNRRATLAQLPLQERVLNSIAINSLVKPSNHLSRELS